MQMCKYATNLTDVTDVGRLLGPRPHRRGLQRSLSRLFLTSLVPAVLRLCLDVDLYVVLCQVIVHAHAMQCFSVCYHVCAVQLFYVELYYHNC